MHTKAVLQSELFATLPPVWPEDLSAEIRRVCGCSQRKLVVLDDDPTGTQTVHDVPVLTVWDVPTLCDELRRPGACFYLLTNSRSLTADAACRLNAECAQNLQVAAAREKRDFVLVSRSDSTLRGHFPAETDVLADALGPVDATIVAPYFEAGGRHTVGNIHYVAEGARLIPAAQTPFAEDPVFGYRSSDLRAWVEEKTRGRVRAAEVHSVDIELLRVGTGSQGPVRNVVRRLQELPRGSVCIVNACHPRDMEVFALASLLAEQAGRRFLYRTAAQFVAARLGLSPRPLWQPAAAATAAAQGGLTVVGSFVPKTTAQLEHLLSALQVAPVELSVSRLLESDSDAEILAASARVNHALRNGRSVVVYTSRQLVTANDATGNLLIGQRVSAALVRLVQALEHRPRYLVAKGGITSSDVATKGLGVRRAVVLGQVEPGVPVWELGGESKFPQLPYVVFPGNVGGTDSLARVVRQFGG